MNVINIILGIFFIITQAHNCLAILPEAKMTTVEIILYHGYPVQVFHAYTTDGYILDLHRIPFGKSDNSKMQKYRPVVLLQHGLFGSSADWVENFPNQSFDATFDVILNETKQKSLYYVGFSQGTLIMFAKLSQDPNFASKIQKFFALAPVGGASNVKGLLHILSTRFFNNNQLVHKLFGEKFFFYNKHLMRIIGLVICDNYYLNKLCSNVLFQMAGPENDYFNKSRISVYIAGEGGTSVMNLIHWIQMINSEQLRAYDYGSVTENQIHYGSDLPPIYNLGSINAPIYLYWGYNDWIANPIDIEKSLLSVLPEMSIKGNYAFEDYNHLDFIWGLNAVDKIYQPIISIINEEKDGKLY